MKPGVIGKPLLGFGTAGLLRTGSARGRQNLLAAALANGITHFDTAPIYGLGESERALGRFLRGERAHVTLATKFGLRPSRMTARLAFMQRLGRRAIAVVPPLRRVLVRNSAALYTPPSFGIDEVQASLEHSLRSLRTDYLDLYLAHEASLEHCPGDDLIELLERLRAAGKIRAFGIASSFERAMPVLQERPALSRVVQLESDVINNHAARIPRDADRWLITYGFLSGAFAAARQRVDARIDDETLGGILLRGAVLANPAGTVLMQSRSAARIGRNVRAAYDDRHDVIVRQIAHLTAPAAS